jgi:hypothetical protein
MTCWGHVFLHAAYNVVSHTQLLREQEPNISHLRTFECDVYIPIPPPQRM